VRVRARIVPPLEALLAAALERDELLTDVVETRALRRSDVLKTALLRAVSHDLRTPLTAIIAAAEPLGGDDLDDTDRRDLASGISLEADRLSRLIEQLLDLSRLEADAVAARPDWCAVDEVLRAATEHVTGSADFKLSIDPELPLVRADAVQIERAFANLLENSARHAGGHPVSVRARAVGHRILVRIVDRGPGIPAAQLERVFEPFYRSGDDDTGHRGSGLGLAIARGFLEVNGARVWAESLPNQGTSFVVELPLEPVPSPVAA
jgi:two-component system sensor histidine kinase KdpD